MFAEFHPGLNYFGNEVGFSVDNIVRAQVVLPSGQVVTASADTNSDLFFGVRGGYNNFVRFLSLELWLLAVAFPNRSSRASLPNLPTKPSTSRTESGVV